MKKIVILITVLLLQVNIVKAEEIPNQAFDDYNFYKCVIDNYNTKNTKEEEYTHNLTDDELNTITNLSCSGKSKLEEEKIVSVKGLEKLTNLNSIDLSYNNISTIDVKQHSELTEILMYYNNLTELDVTSNLKLKTLSIYNNEIENIDLSKNTELTYLSLSNNNISNLDISKNTQLNYLSLANNNLSNIDLSQNSELTTLYLFDNHFMNLNLIGINKITDKDNINITPQTREFNLTKENNQYILNLKEYNSELDPEKVVFNNIDGVTYDNTSGIFTITKEVESISYIYKTGIPTESGLSEEMEVKINLQYTDDSVEENHEDEKAEQVQTGSITIGVIGLTGLLIVITYYLLSKKNKLYKL